MVFSLQPVSVCLATKYIHYYIFILLYIHYREEGAGGGVGDVKHMVTPLMQGKTCECSTSWSLLSVQKN